MFLAPLEIGEDLLHLARPRHHVDRAHDVAHRELVELLVEDAEQVLGVHHADDLVDRLVEYRVAGEAGLLHHLERVVERRRGWESDDLGTGRHHLARILLGELQGSADQSRVGRLQCTLLLALLHQHPQFIRRVHRLAKVSGLDPEGAERERGRAVEDPRERRRDPCEREKRRGQPLGELLRMLQGCCSRGQLAEYQVEEADDQQGDHCAEADPHGLFERKREAREDRREGVSERAFGSPPDGQGGQRDAELACREHSGEITTGGVRESREQVAVADHGLQSRAA